MPTTILEILNYLEVLVLLVIAVITGWRMIQAIIGCLFTFFEKWQLFLTGNCDAKTGICLKCLFNTEGDHCEYCKPGYFGDAINDVCTECVCDILGTDPERIDCDRFTGDCHCLPNVVGKSCDRYLVIFTLCLLDLGLVVDNSSIVVSEKWRICQL